MMTNTLFPPSLLPAVTVTACFFSNSCHRPLPVTYPPNCYRFPLVTAVKQKISSRNINIILWCKCSGVGNEQEGVNEEKGQEEGIIKVLCGINSKYNDILIVQTPNDSSRYLLLDSTHNVHSVYNEGQKWTGSYWDEFASLPAIVPKGPIAILGLGGGTAAHLMLDLWPSLELEGWEIDEILIDKARDFLGLSDLENHTPGGGILHVRIGDALSPSVHVPGGYAGIVVDLFANGKVLPQLTEVATWLKLNDKLMPNGRLMVNCGAAEYEVPNTLYPETSSDSVWEKNLSIKAMCQAFPGQLMNWKKMPKEEGENYLALTGPLPDLNAWSASVPDRLSLSVNQWRPCFPQ